MAAVGRGGGKAKNSRMYVPGSAMCITEFGIDRLWRHACYQTGVGG